MRRHPLHELIGVECAVFEPAVDVETTMSDLLPRLVKMLLRLWQSDVPSTCTLGYEYERREARRSAIWVFGILAFLILGGWLLFHWLMSM